MAWDIGIDSIVATFQASLIWFFVRGASSSSCTAVFGIAMKIVPWLAYPSPGWTSG